MDRRLSFWGLTGFSALALTLSGCAKKREMEMIFKERVQEKSAAVDLNAEYIYVPSMIEAPRTSNATRPGAQGTERLVKFKFTENALVAEALEVDPRFRENPSNQKPVVTIPVDHVDYRCADNGAGECANREEEVDDKSWTEKRYFRARVEEMSLQETNTLPIDIEGLFNNCQTEIGSRVVSYQLENDALNVEVERTYRGNIDCIDDLRELEQIPDAMTFNVRYHYSFLKREKAVSKDYQVVNYPETDENTFGMFKHEIKVLSDDNRDEEHGKIRLMSRWNPSRKTIPYQLSANFAKPANAKVLAATKEAVAAVNAALREAGTEMQIELQPPSEKSVGDIRNSMIMMVEDPQSSGVIGYGPSVKDPVTGEIISARTIMYLGTMKKYIRDTWEDYVAAENAKAEAKKATEAADSSGTLPGAIIKLGKQVASRIVESRIGKAVAKLIETRPDGAPVAIDEGREAGDAMELDRLLGSYEDHRKLYATSGRSPKQRGDFPVGERELLTRKGFARYERSVLKAKDSSLLAAKVARSYDDGDAEGGNLSGKRAEFFRRRTELLAKFAYPTEYLNAAGALELATLDGLKDVPRKEWADLSKSEQETVISIVLPYVWVPTLVHELGHNLGLRHNFAGSEDKANFYTEEEGKKHGHSHAMKYSSIMDYGYSAMNELRIMGKYDVAALRFAYRREVALSNGTLLPVEGSLQEMDKLTGGELMSNLAPFDFCTDENVGINPGCRRFDEGTSLSEIASHLLRSYEDRYWKANFRNQRRSFSDYDDGAYLSRIDDLMFDLRPFLETYDRIWNLFGGNPELDPEFKLPEAASFREFYLDLKGAVLASRDALVRPILEPDAGCVVQFVVGPNKGRQTFVSMKQLGGTVKSCFSDYVTGRLAGAGAVPLAQGGKAFRNEKSPESTNPWADQIDTRGIWGDKVLAVYYLAQRRMGVKSWDDYRGNFLDSTTFEDVVIDEKTGEPKVDQNGKPLTQTKSFDVQMARIIDSFLLNDVTAPLHLRLGDGSGVTIPEFNFYPHTSHWIPYQPNGGIRRAFQLPTDDVPYAEILLSTVLGKIGTTVPNAATQAMRDYYGAKVGFQIGDDPSQYRPYDLEFPKERAVYDLGDMKIVAERQHTFAKKIMRQSEIVKLLSKIAEDRLALVIEKAKEREAGAKGGAKGGASGKDPKDPKSELTPDETLASKLRAAELEAYQAGKFDDQAYYELVLRMLGRANLRAEKMGAS